MDQHPLRKRVESAWCARCLVALLAVTLVPATSLPAVPLQGPTASASDHSESTGEQRLLVLLVNFRDGRSEPITPGEARDLFFDGPGSMNAFFREASFGKMWFSGDVLGWYSLAVDCAYGHKILNAAVEAADPDVFFPDYDRVLLYYPFVAGCEAGRPRGTLGREFITTGDGGVLMSVAWVPHGYAPGTPCHEVGHNLGLWHSRLTECPHGTLDAQCTPLEYGDEFGVMGDSRGHFSAYQKERLGWLTPQLVGDGGTFEIWPIEIPTTGVQALKLPAPADGGCARSYYLEHREATGFDTYIASYAPSVANSVLVRLGSACGGKSDLLSIAGATGRFGEIESGASGFLDGPAPMLIRVLPRLDDSPIVVQMIPFGVDRGTVNVAGGFADITGWVGSESGWNLADPGEGPWTVRLSEIHDGITSEFYTASVRSLVCGKGSCAGAERTPAGGLVSLAVKHAGRSRTSTFHIRVKDRFAVGALSGQTIRVELCGRNAPASCVAGQFRFKDAGRAGLTYRRPR